MDFLLEEIIPIAIFIIIPIIRGLNNSKKQKKEYEEKRRKVSYHPPKPEKDTLKPWKNVLEEVSKEIKKSFKEEDEKENKKEEKSTIHNKHTLSIPNLKNSQQNQTTHQQYVLDDRKDRLPNRQKEDVTPYHIDKHNTTSQRASNSMGFSENPIIQGIIFSEILGPPKAKRK